MDTLAAELPPLSFRRAMFKAYGIALLLEGVCVPLLAMLFNASTTGFVNRHQAVWLVYIFPLFLPFALPLAKERYRGRVALAGVGVGVLCALVTVLVVVVAFVTWLFSTMGPMSC